MTSFKFFLSCSSISDVSWVSSIISLVTVLLRGLEGAPLVLTLSFFSLSLPFPLFAVLDDIEDDLEDDVGDGEDLLSGTESSPSGGTSVESGAGGSPTPVLGEGGSKRPLFLS